jgi:hypothetical protein
MQGHRSQRGRHGLTCEVCHRLRGSAVHVLALAGMVADCEGEEARQRAKAAELTARLIELRASIDGKVGELERESPLFYGTGENPTLWWTTPNFGLIRARHLRKGF